MCYPVYGIVHIKEPLLLNGKSSPCGSSAFHFLVALYHMSGKKEGNVLFMVIWHHTYGKGPLI